MTKLPWEGCDEVETDAISRKAIWYTISHLYSCVVYDELNSEVKKAMGNFCVYCHTNKLNGKKYIGITKQKPEERWRQGKGYKKGAFHNALKKYGWDGFSHVVLYSELSEVEAKEKEIELIAKYHTNEEANGYNITEGGDGTSGYKRSADEIKAMSISRKGRHVGNRNPMYGKSGLLAPHYGIPMSDSAKEKAGAAIRARHIEGAYRNLSKAVLCEKGEEIIRYESIAVAERSTGVPGSLISRVCKGKRKTAGGYNWKYDEQTQEIQVK